MDERCKVLNFLKEIPGYEKSDEVYVDEWLSAVYEGDQQLSDQEIISLITQDSNEESDTIDEVDDIQNGIFHILKDQNCW